jgi:hypothetical protein
MSRRSLRGSVEKEKKYARPKGVKNQEKSIMMAKPQDVWNSVQTVKF